jgi:hypothetical protein
MRLWHTLAAAAVALAAAANAPAAPAAGKHPAHTLRGVVEAVHLDKKKDHGTIVVKVHHHHPRAAGQAAAAPKAAGPNAAHRHHHHEVKVHVDLTTRFARVAHTGKGQTRQAAASFADVHKGEHVRVVEHGAKHHHARKVDILVGHVHAPRATAAVPRVVLRKRKVKAL